MHYVLWWNERRLGLNHIILSHWRFSVISQLKGVENLTNYVLLRDVFMSWVCLRTTHFVLKHLDLEHCEWSSLTNYPTLIRNQPMNSSCPSWPQSNGNCWSSTLASSSLPCRRVQRRRVFVSSSCASAACGCARMRRSCDVIASTDDRSI